MDKINVADLHEGDVFYGISDDATSITRWTFIRNDDIDNGDGTTIKSALFKLIDGSVCDEAYFRPRADRPIMYSHRVKIDNIFKNYDDAELYRQQVFTVNTIYTVGSMTEEQKRAFNLLFDIIFG